MPLLAGTVEKFERERGFGSIRLDDGTSMPFDINASSFEPERGDRIRAYVGPGLRGAPKVLRLALLPSLDDPRSLESLDDVAAVLDVAEAELEREGPSLALREKLAAIEDFFRDRIGGLGPAAKRIIALYARMPAGLLAPGEPFGDGVGEELTPLSAAARAPIDALLMHAFLASASKPSAKWLKDAGVHLRAVEKGPLAPFEDTLVRWFSRVHKPAVASPAEPPLSDHTSDTLKGLVWIASLIPPTPRMASAVGDLASTCFKKVPNYGAMSAKVGNACLWTLGAMSAHGIHGVAQLGRLKMRVRYAQALKLVDKALADAAERAKMSTEELLELGVPTCGLGADGVSEEEIGAAMLRVRVTLAPDGAVSTSFVDAAGKTRSGLPSKLTGDAAADLKELKARIKDIETLLPAQALRIETMMAAPRDIAGGAWKERYLEHGLVAHVARRLIWWLDDTAAIWADGALADVSGRRVDLARGRIEKVRLWHPLGRPPEEVLGWRRFISEHGITQPFKQAHREIYVLTDAELATETYSNRFAAHVLKQHQLAALLRERGWSYHLQGGWDSASTANTANTSRKRLRQAPLTVEWLIDRAWNAEELSDGGILLYVTTDQVRFVDDHDVAVSLDRVPALAFSEAMRDVDLFVGVTSVGNDPTWRDGGPAAGRGYWEGYAFGELGASAETRKAVLETLLPKLKIKDRVRLEGRYLHVRGELRSYKIHLGSTNILMEPNDQYLCIVPDRRSPTSGLVLPFEGDTGLSLILSKALLLAADSKIDDDSILRQIRG